MSIYTVQADGYDWEISTLSSNRLATIKFADSDTSKSAVSTIKSLYLAVMDRMDEQTEMSDSNPMTADTPTEYNIGKLGAGASDAWFIDKDSVEHLSGGALKTTGWKRVEGTNTGIIRVECNNTNIVEADIGYTIVSDTDGDSGTLLDVKGTGTGSELWIRPDDDTAGNSFDESPTASDGLTCNTHTATQEEPSTTGEMQWSNIYNTGIATLSTGTHQYIYHDDDASGTEFDDRVERYKTAGEDWWEDGTFDILLLVADQSSDLTTRSTFIDQGYAAVFARQYATTYSYYIVDLFAGGRNPIPLETGNDLNNDTGYWTATTGNHSTTFTVGEEINDDSTGLKRGIITAAVEDTSITYYLIGDPQTNLSNGDAITGETSGCTATLSGAPTAAGPAAITGTPGITFTSDNSHDVDADDTNEYYSIIIDCGSTQNQLANMYEWTKYITRNGGTTTTNTDGIEGEQYIGIEAVITYSSMTGTVSEGDTVTGDTSGAIGTVVAIHTGITKFTLRNIRGTFQTGEDAYLTDGVHEFVNLTAVNSITPIKPNPFGVFAGGKWFLAQGIAFDNRPSADANNYSAISDEDLTIYEEPTSITVAMSNTRQEDKVAIFRLDGASGAIEKDYYAIDTGGSGHAEGANLVKVTPNIRVDEPGKSSGGYVIIGDTSAGEEHVYKYSSWTSDEFTLDQTVSGSADGGDTNTLADSGGGLSSLEVGELIHDVTNSEYAWVTEVTSDTSVETTTKATTWNGASYVANDLVVTYTSDDYVYVPLLYKYETTGTDGSPGSEQASLVYSSTIPALARARSATESTYKIKPFGQEISITGDSSTAVIRNAETITS